MRAAVVSEFGGPECIGIEDLPKPVPGEGEVRVRVHYAPVNPTDLMLRSGLQAAAFQAVPQPWIPGLEFAGVIDEIDSPQDGLDVGDAVMGIVSPRRAQGGSQAEYVIVPRDAIAAAPQELGLEAASMIPMNGLTAAMIIDQLEPSSSKTVLVTGGAGVLGGYVIQLARRAGMSVIGHGRPADLALLKELGATSVVSGDEDLAESVTKLAPGGVDGLVDTALLGTQAEDLLRDGGISVQVLPRKLPENPRILRRSVNVLNAYESPGSLTAKVRARGLDVLTPRVASIVPLDEVSHAHQLVEQGGLRGRIILDLTGSENLAH